MIIQDIEPLCEAGEASMAYFYFDSRNANKRGLRDLISSILIQLSARSSPCRDILSKLYRAHDSGKNLPSNNVLTEGLKDMLTLRNQCPIYLIIDALDESLSTYGIPTPGETVLQLLVKLDSLRNPNLHICVTSRPEIDIQNAIKPLSSCRVSLHDESGQNKDIADYIRSVVYSRSEQIMRRWSTEVKEHVIKVLSERADGVYVDYFTLAMLVEIVKQVSVGGQSVGSSKELSSIEHPAYSQRITGIFPQEIRECAEGNSGVISRSCSTSIALSCRGSPAT
jgi:hypothetical protein